MLMYRRERVDRFPIGSPNGSRGFVMPDDMTALAVADGVVWSAMKTARGFAVVIDHRPHGFATFYQHLEKLLIEPTGPNGKHPAIRAGQPIGIIGGDPLDPSRIKHLHFEVWAGGPKSALDPASAMRKWEVLRDPRTTLVARNAGFTFRPVGASGDAYPDWVRDLKFKSGVYLIRDADTHELLYVGSSSGRLYETLTRHLQTWRRYKGYWSGQYAEGHDPGLTYPRDGVEVAVRLTRSDKSLDEEARLIRRLQPRDNVIWQPPQELEDPPF